MSLPWKYLPGGEKQLDVVQLVKSGRARYDWFWIQRSRGSTVLRYAVLRDAMRFDGIPPLDWYRRPLGDGESRDGVRLPASAEELQQIADIVGGSLLTPSMVDQIWLQAGRRFDAVVNGGPPQYPIVATMPILDVHDRIEAALSSAGGDDGRSLVSCVGKYWVLYNQLSSVGMVEGDYAACNYGWEARTASGPGLTPGTQVWQRPGFRHNKQHLDPSQTIRLVCSLCEVSRDGGETFAESSIYEAFSDPELAPLVTVDGKPLTYQRQEGVDPLPLGGFIVMPPAHIIVDLSGSKGPPSPTDARDPDPRDLPPEARPVLRQGDDGPWVELLQHRLIANDLPLSADGDFGPMTHKQVVAFQKRESLAADGIVGAATWTALDDAADDKAEDLGWRSSEGVLASTTSEPGPAPFRPIAGNWGRQQVFGAFRFRPNPTPGNPEGIRILDGWASENIVTVEIPQLAKISGIVQQGKRVGAGPAHGRVQCHRLIADQLKALWQAWEDEDVLDYVITWAGLWNPRFIRGSRSVLSNHAFGTAFDINAPWNGLGRPGAKGDQRGTVWPLVEAAYDHGFYWGGKFKRRDAMHFEVAVPGMKP